MYKGFAACRPHCPVHTHTHTHTPVSPKVATGFVQYDPAPKAPDQRSGRRPGPNSHFNDNRPDVPGRSPEPWAKEEGGTEELPDCCVNRLFLPQWIPSAMMPPVICKARSMKRRVRAAQAVHGSAPCKAPDAAALHSPNALQCESERQPNRGRAFKTAPACCWVPLLFTVWPQLPRWWGAFRVVTGTLPDYWALRRNAPIERRTEGAEGGAPPENTRPLGSLPPPPPCPPPLPIPLQRRNSWHFLRGGRRPFPEAGARLDPRQPPPLMRFRGGNSGTPATQSAMC